MLKCRKRAVIHKLPSQIVVRRLRVVLVLRFDDAVVQGRFVRDIDIRRKIAYSTGRS